MPATNTQDMRVDEFAPLASSSSMRARNVTRVTYLLSSILGLSLLLVCSSGCARSSPQSGQNSSASGPNGLPELTEEIIRERINDSGVREVPEENGAGDPIYWNFDDNEPKEISVVEKQMDGPRASIVLDIKTRSALEVRNPRQLAGQIRTEWELRTGWVLRRWEIVRTENISMKYKNLPKPPANNPNR